MDYENVHDKGLVGSNVLTESDSIILFYTENAKTTSLDFFTSHGKAELILIKVPVGNQSLDLHLISYLGYLIGNNGDKECKYIIISKDVGYDKVFLFWKEAFGIHLTRRSQISLVNSKKVTCEIQLDKIVHHSQLSEQSQQSNRCTKESTTERNNTNKKLQTNQEESSYIQMIANIHNDLKQELNHAQIKYDAKLFRLVDKVIKSERDNSAIYCLVHNEIRRSYPEDYIELYATTKAVLKKHLTEVEKASQSDKEVSSNKESPNESSTLLKDIEVALLKARKPMAEVHFVKSILGQSKYKSNKNYVNEILVKKFGQARGQDLYSRIKKYV